MRALALPALLAALLAGVAGWPIPEPAWSAAGPPPLRLAVAIPRARVVLCAPPKVGSTMTAWITLRLAGAEARCICQPHLCARGQAAAQLRIRPWFLWHVGTLESDRRVKAAPETIAHVRDLWTGSETAAHWQRRRAVFGPSSAWTRILFTRDPWTRAISAYRDQIMRREVSRLSPTSRDDFLTFTRRGLGDGHHTAAQSDFCGTRLHNITYSQTIDVDHGWESGWAQVLRARPDLAAALTTGWEECTADGSASIVVDNVGKTKHQDSYWNATLAAGETAPDDDRCARAQHQSSAQRKALGNDCALCNKTVTAAVARRYRDDIRLLRRQGSQFAAPHVCAQHARRH